MKARTILVTATLFCSVAVHAAEWTITGTVLEKGTQRPVPGATVTLQDGAAAVTDEKGQFLLTVPTAGSYSMTASNLGETATLAVDVIEGAPAPVPTIYLRVPQSMREMVVTAQRAPERVGKSVIGGETLRKLAGSSGDPLSGLQAMPGVAAVDGSSAPAVRGSGPEDNAFYVDNLYVSKLFHYGAISVFNADLIQDFNLYSAAFGPHYDDVTGAVIDVALREPRKDRLGGKVNINLMGADFLVEGPHDTDKSFYFAARRSYFDVFMKQVEEKGVTFQIPNYWDYQGKYLWQVNEANKLTLHLHGASDILKVNVGQNSDLGQQEPVLVGSLAMSEDSSVQAVTLDSVLSSSAFNMLVFEHTTHRSNSRIAAAGTFTYSQENLILRDQVRQEIGRGHELALGVELSNARVKLDADYKNAPCTQFEPNCDLTSGTRRRLVDEFSSNAWSLSLQDRKRVLDSLTLVGGLRHSNDGYLHRKYTEPRVGAEWEWSADTLLTAGWGRHNQMPSGDQMIREFGNQKLDHIRADHSVLGVAHKVDADWNWKTEAYYKKFDNLVISDPMLNYINAASGKAWGMELLIKKEETDKLSGWWVLNLSKSTRRNDVTGESFRFQYDQPVNTTLVGNYKFSDDWSLGMKWNLHSGTPYTPILGTSGTYPDGRPIPVYAGVNSGTLPVYHRLDLRLDRYYLFDNWKLNTYFELNNIYQRKNVVGYSYDPSYTQREPVYAFVFPLSFGVQGEF
jgi:hypothetical protein